MLRYLIAAAMIAACSTFQAFAQPKQNAPAADQPAPPAPYAVLKVSPPKPFADASLRAFRATLTALAKRKDRAALAKLVVTKDFFWLKEDGDAARPNKAGIDYLATALNLSAKDGSGWDTLAQLTSDETATPYPDRPNTVCSPAGPDFKMEDLQKLMAATKTDLGDWGFLANDGVGVRATANAKAPLIEELGMQFVRVMPDSAPNASQDFMRIVTPSGKVGFVSADAVNPLGSDQLCYIKVGDSWRIAGIIGGQ
jgi:hypothetical protein